MFRMLASLALFLAALSTPASAQHARILNNISLPEGFTISVFAEVPAARHMTTGPDGTLYVSSKRGSIFALRDTNGDGRADEKRVVARKLNRPGGLAFWDGELYVGLLDEIVAFPPSAPSKARRITSGFVSSKHHGFRIIGIGPDARLYVTLGAPCNICELEANTGKIISTRLDGSDKRIVADGVRNSVGFDWHPRSKELWFTDNGADGMGDELPADELNHVTKPGAHFGFPWRGGKNTPLTGYAGVTPPIPVTGAALEMQAHSANLGMDFYEGDMLPSEYRGDAFIAQHGSWNRSVPIGYRVVRVKFNAQGLATSKEVFAQGWLDGTRKRGRPVDVEEAPDGALLVSDDGAGLIYRIAYAP